MSGDTVGGATVIASTQSGTSTTSIVVPIAAGTLAFKVPATAQMPVPTGQTTTGTISLKLKDVAVAGHTIALSTVNPDPTTSAITLKPASVVTTGTPVQFSFIAAPGTKTFKIQAVDQTVYTSTQRTHPTSVSPVITMCQAPALTITQPTSTQPACVSTSGIQFTVTADNPTGTIADGDYQWVIQDVSSGQTVATASGSNPVLSLDAGDYSATVSVANSCGSKSSATVTFSVVSPLIAVSIEGPGGCILLGDRVVASALATDPPGTPIDVTWSIDGTVVSTDVSLDVTGVAAGNHILTVTAVQLDACQAEVTQTIAFTVRPASVGVNPPTIAAGGVKNGAHTSDVIITGCPGDTAAVRLSGGAGVLVPAVLSFDQGAIGPGQEIDLALDDSGKAFGMLTSPDLEQAVTIQANPGAATATIRCFAPDIGVTAGAVEFSPQTGTFTVPVTVNLAVGRIPVPVPGHVLALSALQLGAGCGAKTPPNVSPALAQTDAQGVVNALATGTGGQIFQVIATDDTAYFGSLANHQHKSASSGIIQAILPDEVLIIPPGSASVPPFPIATTVFVGDAVTLFARPANSGVDCNVNTSDDIMLAPDALRNPVWTVGTSGVVSPMGGTGASFTFQAINKGSTVITCTGTDPLGTTIHSLNFTVTIQQLSISVLASPVTIFQNGTSTIQASGLPEGGSISLSVDQPLVFDLPPVSAAPSPLSVTGTGQSAGVAQVTGTYTYLGRQVSNFAFVNVEAPPPPGVGEVRITDIRRVLPGGFKVSIINDPVPTGWDLDTALEVDIRNSTGQDWYARFSDPVDNVFDTITSLDEIVQPIGPQPPTVAAAQAGGSRSSATRFASATTPNLPCPTERVLPARSMVTFIFHLVFPPLPTGGSIGDNVLCSASSTRGGAPATSKRVDFESVALRLVMDYATAAEFAGTPVSHLVAPVNGPIMQDKWNDFIPGSNAAGVGTDPSQIIALPGPPPSVQGEPLNLSIFLVKNPGPREVVTQNVLGRNLKGRINWSITATSNFRGVACNWGSFGDISDDVSFARTGDMRIATTSLGSTESATTQVFIKDYAATAQFQATLLVYQGNPLNAQPTDKTVERTLPASTEGDGIADAWKSRVLAQAGKDASHRTELTATADDDRPISGDQTEHGDGLSVWEEYRGFKVKGVHRRSDELGDDTPGADLSVHGGPFSKDVFLLDQDGVFSGFGSKVKAYGLIVHLLAADEAFTPGSTDNPAFLGSINHNTPDTLRVTQPSNPLEQAPVPDQFRLEIVNSAVTLDQNLLEFGSSGELFFRSSKLVVVDLFKLGQALTSTREFALTTADPRLVAYTELVLAHEIGHRLTLRHPLLTVPVTRFLTSPADVLDLKEGAPIVPSALLPDASALRARDVAEHSIQAVEFQHVLRRPLDLFLALPTSVAINEGLQRSLGDSRAAPEAEELPPIYQTGSQEIFETSSDWSIRTTSGESPTDFATRVRAAMPNVYVRFVDFNGKDLRLPTPPDWMDAGAGSVYLPVLAEPATQLRNVRLWRRRPANIAIEQDN